MAQNIHYHSKMEEREHSRLILDQSKVGNQQGKVQTVQILHLLIWCQKCSSDTHSFQLCGPNHTPFSWAGSTLLATLLCRFPTALASPTSWGSPRQSRLYLHSFTQRLSWASRQRHMLGLNIFLSHRGCSFSVVTVTVPESIAVSTSNWGSTVTDPLLWQWPSRTSPFRWIYLLLLPTNTVFN